MIMEIKKNKVVSFDYTLKDDQGNIITTSKDTGPLVYLHGYDNLIPGLEQSLENRKLGDLFKVTIPPEQGYGLYDDNLVMTVKKDDLELEEEITVGSELEAHIGDDVQLFYVKELDGNIVVLDGNHPLAGMILVFEVKVLDIREATKEEEKHGHAHSGEEGHSC